jgi:radical SAM/Cys-rich protein
MDTRDQLRVLAKCSTSFEGRLGETTPFESGLKPLSLTTIQINVGRLCNQACAHCHVEASPYRTEIMDRETAETCLDIIARTPQIETVDITGGAPEMNPNFTFLVEGSRCLCKRVIDRCNLTILEADGYEHLYDFLSGNEVEIVASLPHFNRSSTDRQRGQGVYERSITALKKLNGVGYPSHLPLNLVYNPTGLYLSNPQEQLEREFRVALRNRHGIEFSGLLCINNFPIGRFLDLLVERGKYDHYMDILVTAYNAQTVNGLMCRHQMSVGYDGKIYDCDFNQMLDIESKPVSHVKDFDLDAFLARRIQTANHCFACTAGGGSSCGGELDN